MKKIKFNLIDVLIIIVIIQCIMYLGFLKVKVDKKKINPQPVIINYKLKLQNQDSEIFMPLKINDIIKTSSNEKDKATIKNVEIVDYEDTVLNKTEKKYVVTKFPNKLDVIITLETKGIESDDAIIIGNNKILIGEKVPIEGLGYSYEAWVMEIECKKEHEKEYVY
ncbi:MAG: DUF4330 domain-containing protein [Clostridiales bacterium]|jgi:hypothetical protein|nr:DUF4330 domain-containing protein [Clostridiales bacterium]